MVTPRAASGQRPGTSLVRLLLLAALAGAVGGVVLFAVRPDAEIDQLALAEQAAARDTPLGEAASSEDPMAPDPQSLRGIPAYPNAYPRRLMNNPSVQGVRMSVSWFETLDSPDAVLSFYERQYAGQNREYVSHRYNERLGFVAFLERLGGVDAGLAHGIMHMVSASKEGQKTVVLLSASRPDMLMEAEPALPEGVKLPEATEAPQLVQMGEVMGSREVVLARTLNKSPSDVVEFFAAQLKQAGWQVMDEAAGPEQKSLVGKRGRTTLVVNASPDGVDSNLMLTFNRQQAPEAIR